MNMFQVLAVGALLIHCSSAQIFPFSNLRAFFDPKTKPTEGNEQLPTPGGNISRPYRQADQEPVLPLLHEFDSPDIFTINRNVDNHRGPTVKRHPASAETEGPPPKRRGSNGRYRPRLEHTVQQTPEQASADSIYITPNPESGYQQNVNEEIIPFTKIKPKIRVRGRKPQQSQELQQSLDPVETGNSQITNNEQIILKSSANPINQSPGLILSSEEPTFVETVPSLAVAIQQNQFDPNGGLVDYLVPPKLPSVYEKSLKPQKPYSSHKLKPPHPTVSKKDNRIRIKKRRNEVKSTSIPLAERLTTTPKRHVIRRRPSHHREPARKPTTDTKPAVPLPDRKPLTPLELQKQATQMDEQITAETGFTGAASHPHPHHGGQRVEFQMHGQKGPHSYKFGYDTGKGHNRQFRYEEKDNHGHVKGHYGFYDKEGKLQIVNYSADPHQGFKAESL